MNSLPPLRLANDGIPALHKVFESGNLDKPTSFFIGKREYQVTVRDSKLEVKRTDLLNKGFVRHYLSSLRDFFVRLSSLSTATRASTLQVRLNAMNPVAQKVAAYNAQLKRLKELVIPSEYSALGEKLLAIMTQLQERSEAWKALLSVENQKIDAALLKEVTAAEDPGCLERAASLAKDAEQLISLHERCNSAKLEQYKNKGELPDLLKVVGERLARHQNGAQQYFAGLYGRPQHDDGARAAFDNTMAAWNALAMYVGTSFDTGADIWKQRDADYQWCSSTSYNSAEREGYLAAYEKLKIALQSQAVGAFDLLHLSKAVLISRCNLIDAGTLSINNDIEKLLNERRQDKNGKSPYQGDVQRGLNSLEKYLAQTSDARPSLMEIKNVLDNVASYMTKSESGIADYLKNIIRGYKYDLTSETLELAQVRLPRRKKKAH